jgi:DNA polymerase V
MDTQDPPSLCKTRDSREATSPPTLFGVAAGFSSPASDFCEGMLDVNAYLLRHRAASFYFNVEGDSMKGVGILNDDKVLVDRAVAPQHGHIVIAVVNSEYMLRRLYKHRGMIELRAENASYPPIRLGDGEELQVWGVVVGVVRKYSL